MAEEAHDHEEEGGILDGHDDHLHEEEHGLDGHDEHLHEEEHFPHYPVHAHSEDESPEEHMVLTWGNQGQIITKELGIMFLKLRCGDTGLS